MAELIDFFEARDRVRSRRRVACVPPALWPLLGLTAATEMTAAAAGAALDFGRREGWWR